MKKLNNTLIVIISLMVIQMANAQWKVGIIGGMNVADIKADTEIESRTLSGFGMLIEYAISDGFSLLAMPMYIQNGGIKIETDDVPELKIKGSYIDFPLLLKYSFSFGEILNPFLFAGPSVEYRLDYNMQWEMAGFDFIADLKSVTRDFDFGIGFGAGVEIPLNILSIVLECKYYLGLTDQHKDGTFIGDAGWQKIDGTFDEGNRFKNRGIQILWGITIPIGN